MKLIKTLSDRPVSLYLDAKNKKIVERYVTQQQLGNILEFYKSSDFDRKPKLLYHDNTGKIRNEWINGDILNVLSDFNIKKLAHNIVDLSKKHEGEINLSEYIKSNFQNKIDTISLSKEQKICVNSIFNEIFLPSKEQIIGLNWTHGDLKGENIILNKNEQYIIDWEWVKKGNYMEDIQSILQKNLGYDPRLCDKFINQISKLKNIDHNLFLFLDSFHYFLNMILQLSKNRIDINIFKDNIDSKMISRSQGSIYHQKNISSNLSVNKNKERLIQHKEKMIQNKKGLIFHSVAFKSTTGDNILLGGKSGSGKSFIFQKLKELGLVTNLYDQDLVKYKDGSIYPLTDQSFKGFENGEYIYENNINNNYGKLDYIFFIDNNFYGIKETNFDNNNIVKYLLHEEYDDILDIYNNYILGEDFGIKCYIIGNNKTNTDFTFLQDILSKSQ